MLSKSWTVTALRRADRYTSTTTVTTAFRNPLQLVLLGGAATSSHTSMPTLRFVSSKTVSIPLPTPSKSPTPTENISQYNRTIEEKRRENHSYQPSVYKLGKHRSNALDLVHQIPPIEVKGEMAICDGGGGALGHPLEYISLARGPGVVEYCKYCALRYTQATKK